MLVSAFIALFALCSLLFCVCRVWRARWSVRRVGVVVAKAEACEWGGQTRLSGAP